MGRRRSLVELGIWGDVEGKAAGGGEVGESKGLEKQLLKRHRKAGREDGGKIILKARRNGGVVGKWGQMGR